MNKRNWIIGVLVVGGILAAILFLYPPAQRVADSDTEQPTAPDFGSQADPAVAIENARLVLPARAGNPATVYFDVRSLGQRNLVIREVNVEHAGRVGLFDAEGPQIGRIENVSIEPGATLRFAPDARHLVASDYDSNVVPGASVEVTVTLANGQTATAQANVEAGTAPGGGAAAPAGAGQE